MTIANSPPVPCADVEDASSSPEDVRDLQRREVLLLPACALDSGLPADVFDDRQRIATSGGDRECLLWLDVQRRRGGARRDPVGNRVATSSCRKPGNPRARWPRGSIAAAGSQPTRRVLTRGSMTLQIRAVEDVNVFNVRRWQDARNTDCTIVRQPSAPSSFPGEVRTRWKFVSFLSRRRGRKTAADRVGPPCPRQRRELGEFGNADGDRQQEADPHGREKSP